MGGSTGLNTLGSLFPIAGFSKINLEFCTTGPFHIISKKYGCGMEKNNQVNRSTRI